MYLKKFLLILTFLMLSITASRAATFTVTSTLDSGTNTLRWAIEQANITSGRDTIVFSISGDQSVTEGGVVFWRIAPTSALPVVSEEVYIDGTSQATIEIKGQGTSLFNGIHIESSNCTIEGLAINNSNSGIYISGEGSSNNRIIGNLVGTNVTGTSPTPNYYGIYVNGYKNGVIPNNNDSNIIGGNRDNGEGNLVSANELYGIYLRDSSSNIVKGNYVGTNIDGLGQYQMGNSNNGIYIAMAEYNIIGGTTEGERNIIAGNNHGIALWATNSTEVKGNYIGTDKNGTTTQIFYTPNGSNGIDLSTVSDYNIIGGTGPGEGNVICHNNFYGINLFNDCQNNKIIGNRIGVNPVGADMGNTYHGVRIRGDCHSNEVISNIIAYNGTYLNIGMSCGVGLDLYNYLPPDNILISRNSMYANEGKGISTEANAGNKNIQKPIINSAVYLGSGITSIEGTSTPEAIIEIFKTEAVPDLFNQGEGQTFLASTESDSSGNWSATVEGINVNESVTATVTKYYNRGNTSEFAINQTVEALSVTLVAPNGGEVWRGESYHDITWQTPAPAASINLYYTTGEGWIPISSGETDDGIYSWFLPDTPTTEAKVKVEAISGSTTSDESDAVFEITPAHLMIVTTIAPTGEGSLDQAIKDSNGHPGRDTIIFNIPTSQVTSEGGAYYWSIKPSPALAAITDEVHIDGTTQPTDETYHNPSGPVIEIDGVSVSTHGFYIIASNCTIEGMVINNFDDGGISSGVHLSGTSSKFNRIIGNYIGTTISGEAAKPNRFGVYVQNGANQNIVENNLISGNLNSGFYTTTVTNEIKGNLIGTDRNGTADLGNGGYGLEILFHHNIIGGGTAAERNIISGNDDTGIYVSNGDNEIKGNYIGTDIYGTISLGNTGYGIELDGSAAANTQIGGATAGEGNIISGNSSDGVFLNFNNFNTIKRNYIGTDKFGTAALGNGAAGIRLRYGDYNTIGGSTLEGNIIAGNTTYGIHVEGAGNGTTVDYNEIKGNFIGTNVNGADLGNGQHGVYFNGVSQSNNIGPANTIAYNGTPANENNGIYLDYSADNIHISRNSMYENSGKGISLEAGANNDLAYPVIASASYNSGNSLTTISGTAPVSVSVEVFKAEDTPDLWNQGEGKTFLGFVKSDASSGTWEITVAGLNEGDSVTATSSDYTGFYADSSEFALNVTVEVFVPPVNVTLHTPNGGEIWRATSVQNITWETTNNPTSINLYYTTDEADNRITIAIGETDDGIYPWPVPNTPTKKAKVIIEAIGSIATDESNNFFRITAPDEFVVITTTDTDEAGSLRNAINSANSLPGRQKIIFDIPSGEAFKMGTYNYWSIPLSSPLPAITEPVYINGPSQAVNQPGYINPFGPEIEINGNAAAGGYGLVIGTRECTVEGLAISRFFGSEMAGILITGEGSVNNRIIGNYIGATVTGEGRLANSHGVLIDNASDNEIGGVFASERNIISANTSSGIYIRSAAAANNKVINNFIGTDLHGTADLENGAYGIYLSDKAHHNIIGGSTIGERNIISGHNLSNGAVYFNDSSTNEIKGNFIGTDVNGTASITNSYGIYLNNGSSNNLIGGTDAGETNIISGNGNNGIYIYDTNSIKNTIKGNYIGLNASGTAKLANSGRGIRINSSQNSIEANVISGNASDGIYIYYTSSNEVRGNYIGTDKYGTTIISNEASGIFIDFLSNFNKIGGSNEADRNIISGNKTYGVYIDIISNSNEVKGNYIGVNVDASAELPNGYGGIFINNSSYNLIGGNTTNEGNIVSGNTYPPFPDYAGISISNSGSSRNQIKNNYIGTNASGTVNLGNSSYGIFLYNGTHDNTIGPNNIIAFNDYNGIRIGGGASYEAIRQNSMYNNIGKGISLEAGTNNNVAAPVITAANYSGGTTTIEGTAVANATIEVFKSEDTLDEFNQGEGKTYLGITQANGSGSWSVPVSGLSVSDKVTATTTDNNNTSEFALNSTVEVFLPAAAAGITVSISREAYDLIISWVTSPEGGAIDLYRLATSDATANIYTNEVSAWTRIITNETFSSTRETNQIGGGFAQAYYKVISAGETTELATAEALGKFNKAVPVGLSLFSVPLLPTNTDIDIAIGDQLSNNDVIYYFTGTAWQDSTTNGTTWTGGVTDIYPDLGYWVRVQTTPTTVTVWGDVSNAISREVSLASGLNLKGTAYPIRVTLEDSDLGAALTAGSGADTGTLYYFTGSAWQDSSWNGTSWYNKGISYFYPTRGYWIRRNNAAGSTWYYPRLY